MVSAKDLVVPLVVGIGATVGGQVILSRLRGGGEGEEGRGRGNGPPGQAGPSAGLLAALLGRGGGAPPGLRFVFGGGDRPGGPGGIPGGGSPTPDGRQGDGGGGATAPDGSGSGGGALSSIGAALTNASVIRSVDSTTIREGLKGAAPGPVRDRTVSDAKNRKPVKTTGDVSALSGLAPGPTLSSNVESVKSKTDKIESGSDPITVSEKRKRLVRRTEGAVGF